MPRLRKEVILDFDYTLFDAGKLKLALADSLRQYGVGREHFFTTYPRAVQRHAGRYSYSLERHVDLLRGFVPALPRAAALRAFGRVVAGSWRYLYPDTTYFLRQLRRHGFHIMLVTHGNPAFQRRKLRGSRIRPFFDTVVFSNQLKIVTLRQLARRFDEVFFVSDHPRELAAVKHRLPQLLPVMKLGGHGDLASARSLGIPAFRSLRVIEKFIINYYKKNKIGA